MNQKEGSGLFVGNDLAEGIPQQGTPALQAPANRNQTAEEGDYSGEFGGTHHLCRRREDEPWKQKLHSPR